MTQHIPAPWKTWGERKTGWEIIGGGAVIANIPPSGVYSAVDEANAAFIVRACNSHYELLEALRLAEIQIESFYVATMTNAKSRDDNKAMKKIALENVRAAIAKAEGRI